MEKLPILDKFFGYIMSKKYTPYLLSHCIFKYIIKKYPIMNKNLLEIEELDLQNLPKDSYFKVLNSYICDYFVVLGNKFNKKST